MVQVMLVRDGLCERHDDSLTCGLVYRIFFNTDYRQLAHTMECAELVFLHCIS